MKTNDSKTSDDVILADVALRKKVLALLIIIGILGGLGIYYFQMYLQILLNGSDVSLALRRLKEISIALFLPMLPLCTFLLHLSRKIYVTQQYPPIGSKVVRDTKISHGRDAILRAKALAAIAVLLACVSTATIIMLLKLLGSFAS